MTTTWTAIPASGYTISSWSFSPSVSISSGCTALSTTCAFQANNASTLTVAFLQSQTITVTTAAPASAAYNSTFPVAATANSGLTVAITVSGGCTISAGTVTMTSPTTACYVLFNQSGNTDYAAATQVTESVTATTASQTITVTAAAPASAAYNSTFPVAATANSGLTVAITVSGGCTISAGTVTMTSGSGTCTVNFNQAGNADYAAATQVSETVTASKAAPTAAVTLTSADPVHLRRIAHLPCDDDRRGRGSDPERQCQLL